MKRLLSFVLVLMATTGAWALEQDDEGYYLIGTAQQLKDFAALVNGDATSANAKLTADIDLAGNDDNQWTPIGTSTTNRYNGTFDGQGYTVKNLYFKQEVGNIGFFGMTNTSAYIKDVRVEGMIDITNPSGSNTAGKNVCAGGIVADASGSVILNCSFAGSVIAYSQTGGIVGMGSNVKVVNCYNVGDVKNTASGSVIIYPVGSTGSYCYYRNGCCQSSKTSGWSNGNGGTGTAMSVEDMKASSFVTMLNTAMPKLVASYPDIREWKASSDGYPVHGDVSTAEEQIFDYTISGDGVTITGFAQVFTVPENYNLVIPDEIEGTKVVAIANQAFNGNTKITSLVLGANVKTLGNLSFVNCGSLASVDFSRCTALTTIGAQAFRNADQMTTIVIPNTVTTIGNGAFSDCNLLTTATLPTNLADAGFGTDMFSACIALTSVNLGELTDISIIPASTFQNCRALTAIPTIPVNVTTIDRYAFAGCSGITGTLTIPSTVTTMGEYNQEIKGETNVEIIPVSA